MVDENTVECCFCGTEIDSQAPTTYSNEDCDEWCQCCEEQIQGNVDKLTPPQLADWLEKNANRLGETRHFARALEILYGVDTVGHADDIGRDQTPALGPEQVLLLLARIAEAGQAAASKPTNQHAALWAEMEQLLTNPATPAALRQQAAQLAQAQASGWVSVAERLPKPLEDVLFFSLTKWEGGLQLGHYYEGLWFSQIHGQTVSITHWQKLPAPPRPSHEQQTQN